MFKVTEIFAFHSVRCDGNLVLYYRSMDQIHVYVYEQFGFKNALLKVGDNTG